MQQPLPPPWKAGPGNRPRFPLVEVLPRVCATGATSARVKGNIVDEGGGPEELQVAEIRALRGCPRCGAGDRTAGGRPGYGVQSSRYPRTTSRQLPSAMQMPPFPSQAATAAGLSAPGWNHRL